MSHDKNASIVDEAVRFSMHGPEKPLEVTIEPKALQVYFGAGDNPQSWLAAYVANFRIIHAVAQLSSEKDGARLTLGMDDFSEEHLAKLRDELDAS